MNTLRLEALGPDGLDAFAELLGRPDFGGCFCAVWTHFGPDWGTRCADPSRPNLVATRHDVDAGRKPGFLVWRDRELVGWTGAGPRSELPALATRLGSRRSDASGAWAIGCLAIPRAYRGQGLADDIVDALIARARSGGAACIEAFPVRPWDERRSYRGSARLFTRHGFREIAAEADGDFEILLMRRELTGS